jgi:hypothetical protein
LIELVGCEIAINHVHTAQSRREEGDAVTKKPADAIVTILVETIKDLVVNEPIRANTYIETIHIHSPYTIIHGNNTYQLSIK